MATTASTQRTTTPIAHLKVLDHERLKEGREGSIWGQSAGFSIRLSLNTDAKGRPGISAVLSEKIGRMRASGKGCEYWKNLHSLSAKRTAAGLVVLRMFSDGNADKYRSRHLYAGDEGHLRSVLAGFVSSVTTYQYDASTRFQITHSVGIEGLGQDIALRDLDAALDQFGEYWQQALDHLGPLPEATGRLPMLAEQIRQSLTSDGRGRHIGYNTVVGQLPESIRKHHLMFVDAQDPSDVARKLWGKRAYTKPLGRAVAQAIEDGRLSTLAWYSLYRGLVPTEWIVSALDAEKGETGLQRFSNEMPTSSTQRNIRAILRRLPQPVLRRILAEGRGQSQWALTDAGLAVGSANITRLDLDMLDEIIALRGQRNLRSSRDVEAMVRRLPETAKYQKAQQPPALMREIRDFQEMSTLNRQLAAAGEEVLTWDQWNDPIQREAITGRLEEIQRAARTAREQEAAEREERRRLERIEREQERHAWAQRTSEAIRALEFAGYEITVATESEQLVRWGAIMSNCIGDQYMGYQSNIGLDVFVAITETGSQRMVCNMQITHERGIAQMLGKHNSDLDEAVGLEDAWMLVEAFEGIGLTVGRETLGLRRMFRRQGARV